MLASEKVLETASTVLDSSISQDDDQRYGFLTW